MKNSVRLNWKPAREKVASLPPLPEPRHRILASICILIYKNESSSTATHLDIIFQGRVRRKRQYHILASAILLRPRRTSWLCWSSYFPEDLWSRRVFRRTPTPRTCILGRATGPARGFGWHLTRGSGIRLTWCWHVVGSVGSAAANPVGLSAES